MNSLQKDLLENEWMTAREVASLLQTHVTTVRRWSRSGALKSYRIGPRGHRRYLPKDILACLHAISPEWEKQSNKE
jgi:excisionase family DNA binding protein